jgi:hypothetical protein
MLTLCALLAMLLLTHSGYAQAPTDEMLAFASGFKVALPPGVCVRRSEGVDYDLYRFYANGNAKSPFLEAYAGNAANFPLSRRASDPPWPKDHESPLCDGIRFLIENKGRLAVISGGCSAAGWHSREVLVKYGPDEKGKTSQCVHFWYKLVSDSEAWLADSIIAVVQPGPELTSSPPLVATCP